MFNFFKKSSDNTPSLTTDIHSHLLPGIDDGAADVEHSIKLIKGLMHLGYTKVITTPHIMQDHYPNTPEIIREKLRYLKQVLKEKNINLTIEAAAEYFLDEFLLEKIEKKEELLTFGNNYLLFETGFMNESPYIKDFIFKLKSSGITPVMAHVERYSYLLNDFDYVEDLVERGALIQLNINSLTGFYSKPVKQFAKKLIDKSLIHFLGTDCHHENHLQLLAKAQTMKYYKKALNLHLINHTL